MPLGVIGVALGTVLLPEMSRLLAAGDIAGSARAQARAAEIGLLLTLPCMALFVLIPHEIMLGLFSRGAFDQQAAASAATVLQAYALGMPAFILIRCVTPMFHARGDTVTPARATLTSIGFNMAVKVGLIFGLGWGAEGLALGTSVGAWISLGLLLVFAWREGLLSLPPSFGLRVSGIAAATAFMIAVLVLVGPLLLAAAHGLGQFGNEVALMALGLVAGGAYGLAAFGQGLHRRL
ncbi:MAG TPA: hypothetical protein DCL54_14385 [Alphaproteobacteria bacterium]|nr:hypothetical protein [Alphaproteobacteria bacterium]